MRKIKKAKISFISLCPKGMNQMPVIFKEDGTVRFDTLVKGDASEGELTAVVYVPDRPDKEGDYASRQVIKEMAYEYLRDHRKLDLRHDGKALRPEQAYVAQNFIIQKGDPRFEGLKDYEGNVVDPEGGWGMVIKIDDPKLQQLYKDGEWNGVSMFGSAELEQSKEDKGVLQKIMDAIRGIANQKPQEEPDMDEKLKKELDTLKSDMGELTKLVKGMAEERAAEKEAAEQAKLEKEEADRKAELERLQKENKEQAEELKKLKKASNQSTEDIEDEGKDSGLSKEELDQIKIGEEIAKAVEDVEA